MENIEFYNSLLVKGGVSSSSEFVSNTGVNITGGFSRVIGGLTGGWARAVWEGINSDSTGESFKGGIFGSVDDYTYGYIGFGNHLTSPLKIYPDHHIETGKLFVGGEISPSSAKLQVNGFIRSGTIYLHPLDGTEADATTSTPLQNTSGNLRWGSDIIYHTGNLDPSDFATAAQGTLADNSVQKVGTTTQIMESRLHGPLFLGGNTTDYTTISYLGVEMSRGTSYLRPVSDNSQTLYIGGGSRDWLNIAFNLSPSGNFTVNGNDIYHEGNLDLTPYNTTGIITGLQTTSQTSVLNEDLNTMFTSLNYYSSQSTNKPFNINSTVLTLRALANYANQIAFPASTSKGLSYRRQINGTWQSWKEVWDSSNLDPNDFATTAQGALADNSVQYGTRGLLDSYSTNIIQNSSGAVNKDYNNCTEAGWHGLMLNSVSNRPATGYFYLQVLEYNNSNIYQIAYPYGSDIGSSDTYSRTKFNGTWSAWKKVWDSGNLDPVTRDTAQTITATKTFTDRKALMGNVDNQYLGVGENTVGVASYLGSARHNADGSGNYRAYWSYDAHFNDATKKWKANRTSLAKKYKVEMGHHIASIQFSEFTGDVTEEWTDADWVKLLSMNSSHLTYKDNNIYHAGNFDATNIARLGSTTINDNYLWLNRNSSSPVLHINQLGNGPIVDFKNSGSTILRITNDGNLQRYQHHKGGLIGSYNSVAANGAKSNPIYCIGSNYQPNEDDLSNMYGIGFSQGASSSFLNTTDLGANPTGWGLYVSAAGFARVFLDSQNGHGVFKGNIYANAAIFRNTVTANNFIGDLPISSTQGSGVTVTNESDGLRVVVSGSTGGTSTNWATASLVSGVTGTVQYKIKNDRLIISGDYTSSNVNGTAVLFTLPTSHRPSRQRNIGGGSMIQGSTTVTYNVFIATNGEVTVNLKGGSSYNIDIDITLDTSN